MLGLCDSGTLSEELWETLPSRALLPCSRDEFFASTGATPIQERSDRRYHRFHLRCHAILLSSGYYHAIYVKDLSRIGVGFYSPIQLFPQEPITLWLPQGKQLEMRVSRCRRESEACYECGSQFAPMKTKLKQQVL